MTFESSEANPRKKVPALCYYGPFPGQQAVGQEVYDHLVAKKLMKLQEAVNRLNALIRDIAKRPK